MRWEYRRNRGRGGWSKKGVVEEEGWSKKGGGRKRGVVEEEKEVG